MITACGKRNQDDFHGFKASLGNKAISCLEETKEKDKYISESDNIDKLTILV